MKKGDPRTQLHGLYKVQGMLLARANERNHVDKNNSIVM